MFTGSLAKLNKRVELIRKAKRMEKTPEKEITLRETKAFEGGQARDPLLDDKSTLLTESEQSKDARRHDLTHSHGRLFDPALSSLAIHDNILRAAMDHQKTHDYILRAAMDHQKTEEIPIPREKSSHEDYDGGHKIPKLLINSVELDDEQMKPPNPKKGSSRASSAGSGTSNDNTTSAAKPKQMSTMAFVQKKKEEALEKRITTSLPYSLVGKIGDYKQENPTILSCDIRERLISEGM